MNFFRMMRGFFSHQAWPPARPSLVVRRPPVATYLSHPRWNDDGQCVFHILLVFFFGVPGLCLIQASSLVDLIKLWSEVLLISLSLLHWRILSDSLPVLPHPTPVSRFVILNMMFRLFPDPHNAMVRYGKYFN